MVSDLINYDDFTKIQFCAGTIIAAKPNEKAIRPAYLLTIDFGEHGIKQVQLKSQSITCSPRFNLSSVVMVI